jgi:superfamily II DNA or RNA helicase
MLRAANLKPIYATGGDEPVELYLEGLMNSSKLDLGLGYFSSSGISTLAIGFAYFIKRGGKVRILINDSLAPEDKAAILEGLSNGEADVETRILKDIISLKDTLSKRDRHFFKCLSWLIASHRLEIKAIVPKNSSVGIVHRKFGIFTDSANDSIIFSGSANFSKSALLHNVEDIMCEFSWNQGEFSLARVKYFHDVFFQSWTGISEVVKTIPIEKVKTGLQEHFHVSTLEELLEEEAELVKSELHSGNRNTAISKLQELADVLEQSAKPIADEALPQLRDYQIEAIDNWKANNYIGLLEMATGTGKTFTALTALHELLKEKKRLVVIISCPFIHLAEQWQEEAKKFNLDALLIGESKDIWEDQAARQSQLFKRGKINKVVFVTTNASFKSESFQKIIAPNIRETLIIIDEAHAAGAVSIRKVLPADCPYRLGLSATPERHGDEEGTDALFAYFDKIIFSYPIEKAIGKYLTNYYYHPIPVELTETEFEEYCNLTAQIGRLSGKTDDASSERRDKLAIKRARVQNNSINKLEWLSDHILELPLEHSLFYAGEMIFDQIKQLLGRKLKISLHEFTSRQSRAERRKLLKDFAEQKIQSLIAMKCLDEGVDVPPTRVAYFLASSSNPREFVQRRGRVLRTYKGKEFAVIYDLISIPPRKFIEEGRMGKEYRSVKTAFVKEYKRIQEFSSMALNQYESLNEIYVMADMLDVLDVTKD